MGSVPRSPSGFLDNDRWTPALDDKRFIIVRTPMLPMEELIVMRTSLRS